MSEPDPLVDEEAERAVLGAVLADSEGLYALARVLVQKDFASTANAQIWEAMQALRASRRPVDHLTLAEELRSRGQLASVGGPAYLMGLDQVVPVAANAVQYAEVVKDRARRRRGIAVLKKAIQRLGDLGTDPVQLAARAAAELVKIGSGAARFRTLREVNEEEFKAMVALQDSGQEPIIRTGLRAWDNALGGVQPTVTIIGGKPGNGKSALVAALCRGMASEGTTVGLFSVEDPAAWLTYRYLSAFSGVPNFILRFKRKTESEWEKIGPATEQISGPFSDRIVIDDTPRITSRDLVARAEDMIRNHGVRVIIVDHLQELNHRVQGGEREDERFRESMGELRVVSNEHRIPLLIFAQCKSDVTGTPNPSWFGNAKDALNQVARVQMILELDRETRRQVIHIVKHTNGVPELTIELGFVAGAAMVGDLPGEERLEQYRQAGTEFEPMRTGSGNGANHYVQSPEEEDRP